MDANPPLPAMLMVFEPHDLVEGMFDEESQTMNELTPEPNVVFPLRADDPHSGACACSVKRLHWQAR